MRAKKITAPAQQPQDDGTGRIVVNTARAGSVLSTVKFGAVRVTAVSPKVAELRRNVINGQAALARVAPKLVKPGVSVKSLAAVPRFRADPQDPSRLIREVNGKKLTGKFVNGKFKALSAKQ